MRKGEHKADKLQRIVWTPGSREKVEVIRHIFAEYDRGAAGLRKIANGLNASGAVSPRGGHWTPHQILSVLHNPVYVGTRVYNKHNWSTFRKGDGKKIRDPKDWVIKENSHEPLVDKELFDRVQAKLGPQTWGRGRPWGRPWLLSGLLYCARCGHRFNGYHKTSNVHGKSHDADYYNCSGYISKGRAVCQSFHVLKSELEEFVLKEIQTRLHNPGLRDDLRKSLTELVRLEFSGKPESNESELKRAIKKADDELDNLLDAIKGGLKWDRAGEEIGRVEARKRALNEELELTKKNRLEGDDLEAVVDQMLGYLEEFGQLMETGTVEQKKAVFKTFVQKIVVDREERKATAFLYTVPVVPYLRGIPYPKEVLAGLQAGPRRTAVMVRQPSIPQPKEIAGSPVGASGDSFSNAGCGGWI